MLNLFMNDQGNINTSDRETFINEFSRRMAINKKHSKMFCVESDWNVTKAINLCMTISGVTPIWIGIKNKITINIIKYKYKYNQI